MAFYIGIGLTCLTAYLFFVGVVFVLTPPTVDHDKRLGYAWGWPLWLVLLAATLPFAAVVLALDKSATGFPLWFERRFNKLRRGKLPRARVHKP